MASCGARLPNHPLAHPMIANTTTTATMAMIVFFLSMITSLALIAGPLILYVGVRTNDFKTPWLTRAPLAVSCMSMSCRCGKKKLRWGHSAPRMPEFGTAPGCASQARLK